MPYVHVRQPTNAQQQQLSSNPGLQHPHVFPALQQQQLYDDVGRDQVHAMPAQGRQHLHGYAGQTQQPGQYQGSEGQAYQSQIINTAPAHTVSNNQYQGHIGPLLRQHTPMAANAEPLHQQHQHIPTVPAFCYEWLSDANGRKFLVKTPLSPQAHTLTQQGPQGTGRQALAPPTPFPHQPSELPINQQPQQTVTSSNYSGSYNTVPQFSPTTGRQYAAQDPVNQFPTPLRHEWRIHPHTGVSYQVQVPAQSPVGHAPHNHLTAVPQPISAQPQLSVLPGFTDQQRPSPNLTQTNNGRSQHVQQSFSEAYDQTGNISLTRQEQVAGIVSLLEGGTTKKQPKIIEFAKKCPSKWSKQATLNNINLPLYAWGAIAELESSLSGRSQAMQESVLLGKLRHLKHT